VGDRRRTAIHEAAHAVAAIALGHGVSLVSIRAGAGYRGITMLQFGPTFVSTSSVDLDLPVVRQPPNVRGSLEADIVVSLAGPMAALYADLKSGYLAPDPCDKAVEQAATDLSHLSPRHRELIVTAEGLPDHQYPGDETSASTLAWALAGEMTEAAAHVNWLRAVARNLVFAHWFQIVALADALLERTVLDGDTAKSIVNNAIGQDASS
jgi:hypothetical protein